MMYTQCRHILIHVHDDNIVNQQLVCINVDFKCENSMVFYYESKL